MSRLTLIMIFANALCMIGCSQAHDDKVAHEATHEAARGDESSGDDSDDDGPTLWVSWEDGNHYHVQGSRMTLDEVADLFQRQRPRRVGILMPSGSPIELIYPIIHEASKANCMIFSLAVGRIDDSVVWWKMPGVPHSHGDRRYFMEVILDGHNTRIVMSPKSPRTVYKNERPGGEKPGTAKTPERFAHFGGELLEGVAMKNNTIIAIITIEPATGIEDCIEWFEELNRVLPGRYTVQLRRRMVEENRD